MNLVLSWNLFIVVVFVVIIAYSLIIGFNRTLKTIIGTYLSVLAADGLGNIVQQFFSQQNNFTKLLNFYEANNDETFIITKILIFVAILVILSVKGAFEVTTPGTHIGPINVVLTLIFGFLNAGLIVSTLLVYVSGLSLIGSGEANSSIIDLYTSSNFVQYMIDYHNFWFSIPVLALAIWSLFAKDPEAI